MRHLTNFDNNLEFAIAKIKHHFSDYDVKNMVDDEIENWVEIENIPDDYEGPIDWYYDHNSGEAEEIVIDQLIEWLESNFSVDYTNSEKEFIKSKLIKEYSPLQSS